MTKERTLLMDISSTLVPYSRSAQVLLDGGDDVVLRVGGQNHLELVGLPIGKIFQIARQ